MTIVGYITALPGLLVIEIEIKSQLDGSGSSAWQNL